MIGDKYQISIEIFDRRFADIKFVSGDNELLIPLDFFTAVIQREPKWTNNDQPIEPEDYSYICDRIVAWGNEKGIDIQFSRGITREETKSDYLKKGWTVIDNPDGSMNCIPPKKGDETNN